MANLALLTQIVADEAWDVVDATELALAHWRAALADGVVTPQEAAEGIQAIENALKEAREAKAVSDLTYSRHRAAETLLRGDADNLLDWSGYRRGLLRDAGLRPVDEPDNVIAFPANNDDAA